MKFAPWHWASRLKKRPLLAGFTAALCGTLLLAGCGGTASSSASGGSVMIGSKNFAENEILAQMMADLINKYTNVHASTNLDMGNTLVVWRKLKKGAIDMYPDYTGTGWLEILKEKKPLGEQAMYNAVKKAYQQKFNITWLKPIGFNDTYTLAVPHSVAQKYHLTTISSLAPVAPKLIAGIDAECQNRVDCLPGLEKTYGLKFKSVKTIDHSLVYEAMSKGDIQVTDAYSTDGNLLKYHLDVLKDNKHFFPAYFAAPVVRMSVLKKYPSIKPALNKLAGKINDSTMEQLNYEVSVSKKTVQQVAKDFLKKQGLL